MADAPGVFNDTLQRRADYNLPLQFLDSNDLPMNLTGWTVAAQVWDRGRTKKFADFTVTYTNRSTGTIALSLTPAQTEIFSDEVYYDVLLTNPSGGKQYYLEGVLYVSEGYTA